VTDLPPGWIEVRLSDMADVIAGQAPPGKSYNDSGVGLPLFQGKTDFTAMYIGEPRLWTTDASKLAEHDDVLLSVRAPVGPTNLARERCAIGRGLAAIRGRPGVVQRYLLYALRATASALQDQATGTTFAAITSEVIRNHSIRLAPTPEQKRIVAAIEEQFSRLDTGVAALERVRQNLKRMRRSALQRTVPDNPRSSWKKARIDETVRIVDYRGRTPPFSSKGIPHLRSFNVKNGQVDWTGHAYVSDETYDKYMSRGFPAAGDLLFTTEAPMGEVAFAPTTKFCMAQRMMLLKPDPRVWVSEYLMYHLWSPWFQEHLRIGATGTTVQGISSRNFRPLQLWMPPPDEQERLAIEIRQKLALARAAEQSLAGQTKRTARLRSAILAAGFSGRLAPQDPSDQAASELIERIAVERVSSNGHSPNADKPRARRLKALA
jgi:type I restriction enzyme, S subunit